MHDKKTVLLLKYMGTELDLEPKILKKTLKGIGVKEIYVGKLEDNAIHLTCFAKWKTSEVNKRKTEIEMQIQKMRIIKIERMKR